MTNFHFCIELMLKAIILTKQKKLTKKLKGGNGHNLINLLKHIKEIGIEIPFNPEEQLLLKTLGECFNLMRYKEGTLQTRWDPSVFLENLKSIFNKIDQAYKNSFKLMSSTSIEVVKS